MPEHELLATAVSRAEHIPTVENAETAKAQVLEKLRVFQLEKLPDIMNNGPEVLSRIVLLDLYSNFLQYELQCLQHLENAVAVWNKRFPNTPFTNTELMNMKWATLLSDIGKTGPVELNRDEQKMILDLFGPDISNPFKTTVEECITKQNEKLSPAEMDALLQQYAKLLEKIGMPKKANELTMRNIYDMHVTWGNTVIRDLVELPAEAIRDAGLHHALNGYRADGLEQETIERTTLFVQLIDVYDACISRSKQTHAEAIASLKKWYLTQDSSKIASQYYTSIENIILCIDASEHPSVQ